MKNNFLLIISVLSLFIASCSNNDKGNATGSDSTQIATTETSDAPAGTRYGIKSGIVSFQTYEMMGVKMTQTTYFDDYGKKECQEIISEMDMMGIKTKQHSMSIMADGYSISYQLENLVNGKDETNKVAKKIKTAGNAFGNMDFSTFTDELKKQYDYKEEGTETVAGVEGTKFSMALDKNKINERIVGVIYKNIMLKSSMKMSGFEINLVANKFEQNADIPADKFGIPAGYTVEEK
ncbi:MAG: hypothetical protein A2X08_12100 [Bacteroidetes bacterium GWA2_32_17]|nr:MAG: hypothetical protein A2X08_12100 [Bacteroidetes bacterium GWA2_32_17]